MEMTGLFCVYNSVSKEQQFSVFSFSDARDELEELPGTLKRPVAWYCPLQITRDRRSADLILNVR